MFTLRCEMGFATNWVFDFCFLTTLMCLCQSSAATVEAWFDAKDEVLGIAEFTVVKSLKHCAIR